MCRIRLFVGILCVVLAVVILTFAQGLRRWYSGLFFLILGIVTLLSAGRWRRETDE